MFYDDERIPDIKMIAEALATALVHAMLVLLCERRALFNVAVDTIVKFG